MVLFDANFSIQRAKQRFRHLLQSSCLREGSKGTGGGESPVFWQVVVLYNCWFEIDAALLLHWQPKKEEKHRHVGENNYSWVTDTDDVQRGAINRWDPRLGSSIKRLMSCSQRKYSFGLTAQRVKKKQREETTPEVSPESQWEAWRVRLSFKHPTVLLISVTKNSLDRRQYENNPRCEDVIFNVKRCCILELVLSCYDLISKSIKRSFLKPELTPATAPVNNS